MIVGQQWIPAERTTRTDNEMWNKKVMNANEMSDLDGFGIEGKFIFTKEEANRIEEALKEEEFRKLLSEYAADISDPRHRAEQNEYIRYLEEQNAIPEGKKLIHPIPGFVLKLKFTPHGTAKTPWTSTALVLDQDKSMSSHTKKKLFVNIVASIDVQPPSIKDVKENSKNGATWSVPYTLGPLRTEYDKTKQQLVPTFDCCFHPDALTLAKCNTPFRELLIGIARQGALQQLKCSEHFGADFTIDLDFCRVLKGTTYISNEPTVLVVSTSAVTRPVNQDTHKDNSAKEVHAQTETLLVPMLGTSSSIPPLDKDTTRDNIHSEKHELIIPQYTISERGIFEIADCDDTHVLGNKYVTTTRPRYLVIRISLPNVSSINELDLEVSEEQLVVTSISISLCKEIKNNKTKPSTTISSHSTMSSSNYALTCKLPYPTWSDQGHAEWNKSKHVLIVTLPVKQRERNTIFSKIDDENCKQKDSVNHQNDEKEVNASSKQHHLISDGLLHNSHTKPMKEKVKVCHSSNINHSRWVNTDYSTYKFDEIQEGSSNFGMGKQTALDHDPISTMKELPQDYNIVYKNTEREKLSSSPPKCNSDMVCTARQEETAQTTACDKVDGKLSTYTSDSSDAFIPSGVFCGTRQGYVFMSGSQGIGYYQDDHYGQHESEKFPNVGNDQTFRRNYIFQSQLAIQID